MSPRPGRVGLRDEILDAAEEILLRTRSEDAVSIRAVAAACGCTAPSIYRHFEDKQHLIFDVCGRHFARLAEQIEAAVAGNDDPLARLDAMGRAYVRFAVENPEHYRVMFMGRQELTPQQYADERMLETGAFGMLAATIQDAIDAGLFRDDAGDAVAVAFAVWASVHGIASIAVAKPGIPGPSVDERFRIALDINLRGLLAPPAR